MDAISVGDKDARGKIRIAAAMIDVIQSKVNDKRVSADFALAMAQAIATLAVAEAILEREKS